MRSLLTSLLVAGLVASCDAFVVAPSLRSVASARMAALRRPCGLPGLVACAAEGSGGEAAVEDAEYYSVAAIRGKQVVANAVTGMMEVYYLVNWAGFDESENTWELASSLTEGCDEALRATISDFEANERAKKEASGGTDLQPCLDLSESQSMCIHVSMWMHPRLISLATAMERMHPSIASSTFAVFSISRHTCADVM